MLPITAEAAKVYEKKSVLLTLFDRRPWAIAMLGQLLLIDEETFNHSARVAFIAGELSGDDLVVMRAAFLHDAGKAIVPSEILTKKRLKTWERKYIDTHARVGADVIRIFNQEIGATVAGHHEFQERRYPRESTRDKRTKGYRNQRIVALADVTDALRSKRTYKNGWTEKEARSFLRNTFSRQEIDLAMAAFLKLRPARKR